MQLIYVENLGEEPLENLKGDGCFWQKTVKWQSKTRSVAVKEMFELEKKRSGGRNLEKRRN